MRADARVLLAVAVLGVGSALAAGAPATTEVSGTAGFLLKIGHDTTRVTGPVLPDGTIDYATAGWEVMHKGVTAENNAYPLVAGVIKQFTKVPGAFYDELPADQRKGSYSNVFDMVTWRPWEATEYPAVAKWLAGNGAALAKLETGKRGTRLCPPRPAAGTRGWSVLPAPSQIQDLCYAMDMQGMEALAAGHQKSAMRDAETIHWLADLMARDSASVGFLDAPRFDAIACRLALWGARMGNTAQKRQWLVFVQSIPERRINSEAIDTFWRFGALESVMAWMRGKPSEDLTFKLSADVRDADWNVVLKQVNSVLDEEVRISREPTWQAWQDAKQWAETLKKTPIPENQARTLTETYDQVEEAFLKRRAGESRDAYSSRLAANFSIMLTAAESFAVVPEQFLGDHARRRTLEIAIALEIYHDGHGVYPETLKALTPGVLAAVPTDPYSEGGAEMKYERRGNGYVVYSIGQHGTAAVRGPRKPLPEYVVFGADDPDAAYGP